MFPYFSLPHSHHDTSSLLSRISSALMDLESTSCREHLMMLEIYSRKYDIGPGGFLPFSRGPRPITTFSASSLYKELTTSELEADEAEGQPHLHTSLSIPHYDASRSVKVSSPHNVLANPNH